MLIIRTKSGGNGAFPPILSCEREMPPEGYALWPEELDTADFYNHNGFVELTVQNVDGVPTVKACIPGTQAWEAWKAALPPKAEKIPTIEQRMETLEGTMKALEKLFQTVLSKYGEASTQ